MDNVKILNDAISTNDSIDEAVSPIYSSQIPSDMYKNINQPQPMPSVLHTQIIGGHGLYVDNQGVSHLKEVVFETRNQIVLGGAIFILEKVFGVTSALAIPTINSKLGIDNTNHATPAPSGRKVCLFGVGTGGCGDTLKSVVPIKFYEDELASMIPLRLVQNELETPNKTRYYGMKTMTTLQNKKAFYFKTFEKVPEIKVHYKDGVDGEDGTPVTTPKSGSKINTDIAVFVENILKIDKKDIREWFAANGNVEVPRINTIGLFSAIAEGSGASAVYKDIKLFSKLNIHNDVYDSPHKTMTWIYRIFTH